MKRNNILISEDSTAKSITGVKFTTNDITAHFGEEGADVTFDITLQNGHIKDIIKDTKIVKCSPKDTYDFEVGALISLMRLCGEEKVEKALSEVFPNDFKRQSEEEKLYQEAIKAFRKYSTSKTTNRDKMWAKYLSNDVVCIIVRRESINDFLKEAEENGVIWSSGPKPTESAYRKEHWDYWRKHEYIYFVINNKTMSFSAYARSRVRTFNYIPPLNAKLFKRGKYAIRVKKEDYDDFRKWCKINGMEIHFRVADVRYGLIYHKETKQVLLNINRFGPDMSIVYNWEDIVTPDTIKGITFRYKCVLDSHNSNFSIDFTNGNT